MSRIMTKPTKWLVRSAKTQISLGAFPVWPESSLSAWRKLGSLATHWAHSEGSDQTGWMPRLIWVFTGRTCHFVCFVMMRLKWSWWCQVNMNLRYKISMPKYANIMQNLSQNFETNWTPDILISFILQAFPSALLVKSLFINKAINTRQGRRNLIREI